MTYSTSGMVMEDSAMLVARIILRYPGRVGWNTWLEWDDEGRS